MSMTGRIIRTVTYEYLYDLQRPSEIPPTVELRDMTVIDDSGPQIFISREKAA